MTDNFYFLIPLRPRTETVQWDRVTGLLSQTLRSLIRQKNPKLNVLVACNVKPDIPEMSDPRISWVHADNSFIAAKRQALGIPFGVAQDKRLKQLRMGTCLRESGVGSAYCMFLDADDLVDDRLVQFVLEDDNERGYFVDSGYRVDSLSGRMAEIDHGFYRSCGSSYMVHFRAEDFPVHPRDRRSFFGNVTRHTRAPELCAAAGRPLDPLPFRAALYVMNHTESSTVSLKGTRSIRRGGVPDEEARPILAANFGYFLS